MVTDSGPSRQDSMTHVSRRSACALLAGAMVVDKGVFASASGDIESALAVQYGLMRRAYQTSDVELMRQFYSEDAVVAAEGAAPVVGLDAILAAGRAVLLKRRDITVDVLRIAHSPHGDWASHFAKLSAYPRESSEPPRVGTAFLLWQRGSNGWRCNAELILVQDMDSVVGFRHTNTAPGREMAPAAPTSPRAASP